MASRADLHNILKSIIGSNHVYFQPPASIRLEYPCIIYELQPGAIKRADDSIYYRKDKFHVLLICKDPDNKFKRQLESVPLSSCDQIYTSDNLYHYSFTIYY